VIRLAKRMGIELSAAPIGSRQFGHEVDPRFSIIDDLTFRTLSGPADIHLRHFYPPRLNGPIEGLLVLMLAWEYGYLPINWIEDIKSNAAECWCYSEAIRLTYLASGIPADKLVVIPLGVDTDVFRPEGLPHVFTTEHGAQRLAGFDEPPFVFLFCGGALDRKSVDLLEQALLNTFAPSEPVVLVVKDFCSQTVYRGGTAADRFRALSADVTRPLVIYMDADLTTTGLAALCRAADVICSPSRAEGFALPAIEGMSCGKPVIVTTGLPDYRAATDDYVDESVGWLVKGEKRAYGNRMIGGMGCCGETWWLEPDVKALGRAMREAYNNREEVRKRGEAAAKRVREGYTWDHTVDKMVERLEALTGKGRGNREEGRGKRRCINAGNNRTYLTPTLSCPLVPR
jgi:glycosyltransferase involved in cell wall biosynthesis